MTTEGANEMTTNQTYKLAQGTPVRTVHGEQGMLVTTWYAWEAIVTVETPTRGAERLHPVKVFTLDGQPLPYRA